MIIKMKNTSNTVIWTQEDPAIKINPSEEFEVDVKLGHRYGFYGEQANLIDVDLVEPKDIKIEKFKTLQGLIVGYKAQ